MLRSGSLFLRHGNCDYHSGAHPSHALIHTCTLSIHIFILLSCFLFPSIVVSVFLSHDIHDTHTHSNTPKHKKSRPQLRQAISLTIQSVFFPMMFPTGTGRRKSDLLPHRAHAVALIWKMISVLLEPINIILVSPVNDTFLPSIVDLTEEGMSVRGMNKGGGGGEEGGREILKGLAYNKGVLHPSNYILTSSRPLPHSHMHAETHVHTVNQPCRALNCHNLEIKPPPLQFLKKKSEHKDLPAGFLTSLSCQPDSKHTAFGSGAQSSTTTIVS